MKNTNKKERVLYYILPHFINFVFYLFITLFVFINNLKKLLIIETLIYLFLSIYIIILYLIKKNVDKIKLIFIYIISYIIDIITMCIFVFKGNYNDILVKLLVILLLIAMEYLIEKLCKFNEKNNLLIFIKENFSKIIFLLIYCILTILIFVKLCLNSNIINYLENRNSYRFSVPKINEIFDNTFQNNFENAIIDQMPINDLLKKSYNKVSTLISVGSLKLMNLESVNKYIKLNNGINLYKNHLVYGYLDESSFIVNIEDDLKNINNIYDSINANIYLYFVETDSNNQFDTNNNYDTVNILRSKLKISHNNISAFEIRNFNDDYKNNFYKTDHHWNYKGSYIGYKQIAKMMSFENIIEPKNEFCFNNMKFNGSKSAAVGGNGYFYDNFCVYDFELPDFYIEIDDIEVENYGKNIAEAIGDKEVSYASFYGGDYAEIIFENKNSTNNKNLLIYSNSFSNAINKLLAANYKKTYVVDGRHYSDYDMVTYIEENKIDEVIIIANNMLFLDNVDW